MSDQLVETTQDFVLTENAGGASSVVLVCEHASRFIPPVYNGLGLSVPDAMSHAAWDPGALCVAQRLSRRLDAVLIGSGISRLVYDCNRPPSAKDAMPQRSEIIDVPGNVDLTPAQRTARTEAVYTPFHAALSKQIGLTADPIIVTVHSFTPIFHGAQRSVEIGVLHDSDTRFADAMLDAAAAHTAANVQRNEPYGPQDGVTHTLKEHAIKAGHQNVMLEIRSDLIKTESQQDEVAAMLSGWIADACADVKVRGAVQ